MSGVADAPQDMSFPNIGLLADAVLDANRSLGEVESLETDVLTTLSEIEMRLIILKDWIASETVTPAHIVNENYFLQFDTKENPGLSFYYMDELFRFAYDYFRASDEDRANIKYIIQSAHRIAKNGAEVEAERAMTVRVKQLGEIATNPTVE